MLSNLINQTNHERYLEKLNELFDTEYVVAILKIAIPLRPRLDKLIWVKDSKGLFFVKSAYITPLFVELVTLIGQYSNRPYARSLFW